MKRLWALPCPLDLSAHIVSHTVVVVASSQAVIEEEGLKLPAAVDGEARNWDQPLITAEPDIQVRE